MKITLFLSVENTVLQRWSGMFLLKNYGKPQKYLRECEEIYVKSALSQGLCVIFLINGFIFFKSSDGVFLAADYSQLELRILAHLSQDVKLIRILNSDGDVFRQIAAQWKNLDEKAVTDQQRQEAKQVGNLLIYLCSLSYLRE